MKVKHLVLEDDVHKALKAHKGRTGATVREIGNAALRAALALPTREELVARKLASLGKLSPQELAQVTAEAEREFKAALTRLGKEIAPPPGTTRRVGSWEVRLIHSSPDGAYQVVLCRARDGKKVPSPLHHHEESHGWRYVLRGRVSCRIGEEVVVLGAHDSIEVPPGVPHQSAPLTRDTAMVIVVAPPEEPSEEKAQRKAPRRARQGGRSHRRGRSTLNRSRR